MANVWEEARPGGSGSRRAAGALPAIALSLGLAAFAGCGGGSAPDLVIPPGCNPLAADWDCLLPYPSDWFLVVDPAMPSGRRVELPETALPRTDALVPFDQTKVHPADGFSPAPVVLALLPVPVDDTSLPFHTDGEDRSTGPESQTILLDAERGERVPHFAELDPRADDDARRALLLRPLVRLRDGARYVVALRGLAAPDGSPVPPGAGFRLLRDRRGSGHPVIGPLVERFEAEVFAPLEAAGVGRSELQLAWDFTVASREGTTGDLLRMRSLVMEAFEREPPRVRIEPEGVVDPPEGPFGRRIEGTIEVPMFLESEELGARLSRDAEGRVVQNGTVPVDFLLLLPRSVVEGEPGRRPARLVQLGHGFFGSRGEVESEVGAALAERAGLALVAVDWWGMSSPDRDLLAEDLVTDVGDAMRFVDRVHQGMINQLALTHAARSTLADAPELSFAGEPAYDPTEVHFYGISMGHILGGTLFAISPHLERAALSVGGCALPHMMFRALPFGTFLYLIRLTTSDPLEQQKLAALTHLSFDRVDPATYAPLVFDEPPAGAPEARAVLMQAAIGDSQVPNVVTHLHARMLGLGLLEPAVREVAGLATVQGPAASAFVEFDFGLERPLPGDRATIPARDNGVHNDQRLLPASLDLIDRFLRSDGTIVNPCDGVCDPE